MAVCVLHPTLMQALLRSITVREAVVLEPVLACLDHLAFALGRPNLLASLEVPPLFVAIRLSRVLRAGSHAHLLVSVYVYLRAVCAKCFFVVVV